MDLQVVVARYHPSNFIKFLYNKRSLFVKLLDRDERIAALNVRLNLANISYSDKKKYIIFLLKCSYNFDFIIFQSSNEGQFCQFGLKDGYLMMDFPVSALNAHLPVLQKVRKLLEKLNFKFTEQEMTYMSYKYSLNDEIPLLDANFGKNYELSAEFVKQVFENIFKEELSIMKVQLGII
jgi:hypothetical protein